MRLLEGLKLFACDIVLICFLMRFRKGDPSDPLLPYLCMVGDGPGRD